MQSFLSRQFSRRRIKWGLLAVGVVLLLWLLASFAVAYRLTRRPRPLLAETLPVVSWGKLEAHRLTTRDGRELGAWFLAGNEEKPSIVLLHGNRECRSSCLKQAEMLAAQAYPVLLLTQRAHGDSTGEINDFGYSARQDVVAAVDWLSQRRPGKPIVLFGRSLGAASAVFAAGELRDRISGYILECPYQDLNHAVRNRTAIYLPAGADWFAYQGLDLVAPLVLSDVAKISPLEAIGEIPEDVPILILAGSRDRHARLEEAQAIYERVKSHAELVVFEGASHLNLFATDAALYRHSVLQFLEKTQRQRTVATRP
jgi:uncharacterized protein